MSMKFLQTSTYTVENILDVIEYRLFVGAWLIDNYYACWVHNNNNNNNNNNKL